MRISMCRRLNNIEQRHQNYMQKLDEAFYGTLISICKRVVSDFRKMFPEAPVWDDENYMNLLKEFVPVRSLGTALVFWETATVACFEYLRHHPDQWEACKGSPHAASLKNYQNMTIEWLGHDPLETPLDKATDEPQLGTLSLSQLLKHVPSLTRLKETDQILLDDILMILPVSFRNEVIAELRRGLECQKQAMLS